MYYSRPSVSLSTFMYTGFRWIGYDTVTESYFQHFFRSFDYMFVVINYPTNNGKWHRCFRK